jgi:hypothetical protein
MPGNAVKPFDPILGLARITRRIAVGLINARPDLEAGARRNAWDAMRQITTRRENYAKARAALLAERDRDRARVEGRRPRVG